MFIVLLHWIGIITTLVLFFAGTGQRDSFFLNLIVAAGFFIAWEYLLIKTLIHLWAYYKHKQDRPPSNPVHLAGIEQVQSKPLSFLSKVVLILIAIGVIILFFSSFSQ